MIFTQQHVVQNVKVLLRVVTFFLICLIFRCVVSPLPFAGGSLWKCSLFLYRCWCSFFSVINFVNFALKAKDKNGDWAIGRSSPWPSPSREQKLSSHGVLRHVSRLKTVSRHAFYRASYASAVLGVVILSVRLSVRPSVRPSHVCFVTNPKKLLAIFFISYERAIFLVFWCQRSRRNSNGVIPNGGAK